MIVHTPVHSTLPLASWSGVYSVLPAASVNTLPMPSTCMVDTVEVPASVELSLPPELQAARATPPATIVRVSSDFMVNLLVCVCVCCVG